MSEMGSAMRMINGTMGCHLIKFPSGRFGFVGGVPNALAYVDGATDEQIRNGERFGGRFGPKTRTFDTELSAREFAKLHGVILSN